jgi:hypothetical protein
VLAKLCSGAHPKPPVDLSGGAGKGPGNVEPRVEYISKNSIQVPFEKAWLSDQQDVEEYLNALREALLEEIQHGKRIHI